MLDNEHRPYAAAGALLGAWREADRDTRSQEKIAKSFVPRVSQAAVSKWEDGQQRPELPRAMQLEGLSGGEVPASAWLYGVDEIAALRAAFGYPTVDAHEQADRASAPEAA